YVYKIHKAPDADVIDQLEKIADNSQDKDLATAIDTMQWIQSSHSLIFNATPEAITKLKSLIPNLDTTKSDMFLYPIKEASKDSITASLAQIMETSSDKELVSAIRSLEWTNNNKTCIFHGTQNAIEELKKILPSIDTPSTFTLYVYKVEYANEADIEEALKQTSQTLQNKEFTLAIQTMQWVPDSHSLVFNATPSTLAILKNLLPSLDASESSKRQVHLYKIEKAPEPQIAAGLAQIKQGTQDKELIFAIDHMQWIQKSNTLAFNTTAATFAKLQEILSSLDVHQELFVYKIQYASEEQIENTLKQMASKSQDNEFILAVQTMQWIPDTKTLVFNTSPAVVIKLQSLLPTLDVSPHKKVYLYKSQPGAEERIEETLNQIAQSSKNKDFMDVVSSLQWVDSTKT
ncbi:MAG: hypothetical protein JSS09_07535, partial [Verrucomicrobia bacterium]|nr:hypothetical protein [Verrucomicrobiota bacterium]